MRRLFLYQVRQLLGFQAWGGEDGGRWVSVYTRCMDNILPAPQSPCRWATPHLFSEGFPWLPKSLDKHEWGSLSDCFIRSRMCHRRHEPKVVWSRAFPRPSPPYNPIGKGRRAPRPSESLGIKPKWSPGYFPSLPQPGHSRCCELQAGTQNSLLGALPYYPWGNSGDKL